MKLLKRKSIIIGCAALVLGLALLVSASAITKPLQDQRQAERWAGDSGKRFKQFTCVLSPGQDLDLETIYSFRSGASEKIAATDFELAEGGSAFCDAWSVSGTVKVRGSRGRFDAAALSVGGKFFDFHPMPLLSGGYLSETDVMKDRVVLDEQLAWMLCGSTDLAGVTVEIGDREFLVVGVVAQADDRFTKAVSEGGPTLYMDYENRALADGSGVSCYEVVLPEPVKGFAKSVAEDPFAKLGLVVENTGRFSFGASMRQLRGLGQLGVRTTAITFPVWENAAVAAETSCALLRLGALVCLVWPAVLLVAALRLLLKFGGNKLKTGGRAAKEALLDRRDAHRMRIISRKGSHTK